MFGTGTLNGNSRLHSPQLHSVEAASDQCGHPFTGRSITQEMETGINARRTE